MTPLPYTHRCDISRALVDANYEPDPPDGTRTRIYEQYPCRLSSERAATLENLQVHTSVAFYVARFPTDIVLHNGDFLEAFKGRAPAQPWQSFEVISILYRHSHVEAELRLV